jgi:hypothetical protein
VNKFTRYLIGSEKITFSTDSGFTAIRKPLEFEISLATPDQIRTFCQEQGKHILRMFSIKTIPTYKVKAIGNSESISAGKEK